MPYRKPEDRYSCPDRYTTAEWDKAIHAFINNENNGATYNLKDCAMDTNTSSPTERPQELIATQYDPDGLWVQFWTDDYVGRLESVYDEFDTVNNPNLKDWACAKRIPNVHSTS